MVQGLLDVVKLCFAHTHQACPTTCLPSSHRYERWSKAITQAAHSVAVLYASDYGFSDRLSQVGGGWAGHQWQHLIEAWRGTL